VTDPSPNLAGTVVHQPASAGRRVRIVRRNTVDPRPGVTAVWCAPIDGDGPETGYLVGDIDWDQPDDVRAWLAAHPRQPQQARR
jgi:hypothetical protein